MKKRIKSFLVLFFACYLSVSWNTLQLFATPIEKPAGRIISLSGTVTISKGGTTVTAKPFQNLDVGDVIITGANSRAAILLRDQSLIKLNANSNITIKNVVPDIQPASTGGSDKTQIQQNSGEVWIRTKNRPGKMEIDTKSGSAAIRGTEFSIIATDAKTTLTLVEGQAELSNPHGTVLVAQNEQAEATPNSAPVKRALTVEETENAVQWIFYFPTNLKFKDEVDNSSIEVLTEKYNQNPNSAEPKTILGVKKLITGKYEEALALFEEAKKINPSDATNEVMRAKALFVLHRQKEALGAINEAIKLEIGRAHV